MDKNIFLREYLSTKVPTYNPQKSVKKVAVPYIAPKVELSLSMSEKYQGIANMLIPCAKPETALAAINKYNALLFFPKRANL